ncbi:MAG: DUF695 domain-containing protein [Clostridia bacterium]|nr:DUF695 domain-containing protein [Clostridia bacterium]MBR0444388.1 DUF695 domain-containing protein [Clostridia bacterium]
MNNENWFEYNWKLRGTPAQFHVDMQFLPEPEILNTRNRLISISCATSKKPSFFEKRKTQAVLKKIEASVRESSVFVGYIELPDYTWYYYYTSDSRLLVRIHEIISGIRSAKWTCTLSDEPGHETYYKLLCPDTARWQSHNNRIYAESLEKRGDDLSQPRRVSVHVCLPVLGKDDSFFEDAKRLGFAIGSVDCIESYQLPYSISLHIISPATEERLTELTTSAIGLAERHSGVFERVDTEFVPKRR